MTQNHYLMHTHMGRANIFKSEDVVADALSLLQGLDFSEYKKEELVRRYVDAMNAAFCTGKVGSTKEPSEDEILRLAGLAYVLTGFVGV